MVHEKAMFYVLHTIFNAFLIISIQMRERKKQIHIVLFFFTNSFTPLARFSKDWRTIDVKGKLWGATLTIMETYSEETNKMNCKLKEIFLRLKNVKNVKGRIISYVNKYMSYNLLFSNLRYYSISSWIC